MKWKIIGKNLKKNFIQEVLNNRGLSNEDIPKYLHTTDEVICSEESLENNRRACAMLRKHIEQNSKILIIWDSDCDGMTSSAILLNFLYKAYPNLKIDITGHKYKMHGLSSDLLIDPFKEKYDLIIIPDAGTNDSIQLKKLSENGTEVIILDHHHADNIYEDNKIIIVNNQLSKNYFNKNFSGAGIVWQFIRLYNKIYDLGININNYLDLVALGNTADVMSLLSLETKHLIFKGFSQINNKLFFSLCQAQSYSMKNHITPMSVGWYIAPIINAIIRTGTPEEKQLFFEAMLDKNSNKMVLSTKRGHQQGEEESLQAQAVRAAQNARNKQNKEIEKGMLFIEEIIKRNELINNKILFITIKEEICNPNLIGLIANKIASKYMIPTIIGIVYDGYIAGSGRNFSNSPIEDFRNELEKSDLFNYVQGHASAFGFSINNENIECVVEYFNNKWKDLCFTPSYYCDFDFDISTESNKIKEAIEQIYYLTEQGLWGTNMEEPIFHISNIPVSTNIQLLSPNKKPTIKINQEGISFMKFGVKENEYYDLYSSFGCNFIDVVATANINTYNGKSTLQLFIIDYEKTESKKFYF